MGAARRRARPDRDTRMKFFGARGASIVRRESQSAVVHPKRTFVRGLMAAAQCKPKYVVTIGGHPARHGIIIIPAKFVSRVVAGQT